MAVAVGAEEEGEAAVLAADGSGVATGGGGGVQLEDGVPVTLVVEAALGGEEDVSDGEDLVSAGDEGVRLEGALREPLGTYEVPQVEQLLCDAQPVLRHRPATAVAAAGFAAGFHGLLVYLFAELRTSGGAWTSVVRASL